MTDLRPLIAQWRAKADQLGYGVLDATWSLNQCADELEAALVVPEGPTDAPGAVLALPCQEPRQEEQVMSLAVVAVRIEHIRNQLDAAINLVPAKEPWCLLDRIDRDLRQLKKDMGFPTAGLLAAYQEPRKEHHEPETDPRTDRQDRPSRGGTAGARERADPHSPDAAQQPEQVAAVCQEQGAPPCGECCRSGWHGAYCSKAPAEYRSYVAGLIRDAGAVLTGKAEPPHVHARSWFDELCDCWRCECGMRMAKDEKDRSALLPDGEPTPRKDER